MGKIFVGLCSGLEKEGVLEKNFDKYLENVLGVKDEVSVVFSSIIKRKTPKKADYYDRVFDEVKTSDFVVCLMNYGFKIDPSCENMALEARAVVDKNRICLLLERGLNPNFFDSALLKGLMYEYYEDFGSLARLGRDLFEAGLTVKSSDEFSADLITFCQITSWK